MEGSKGRQAANRLHALALGRDRSAPATLISRDDDVNEALEEIALFTRAGPPRRLECLVRLEVGARSRQC
jgi:hypothetical protein